MTPAVKLLDKLKVSYQLHQYHHDETAQSYGLEAAEKLAVDAEKIFKTLVRHFYSIRLRKNPTLNCRISYAR